MTQHIFGASAPDWKNECLAECPACMQSRIEVKGGDADAR